MCNKYEKNSENERKYAFIASELEAVKYSFWEIRLNCACADAMKRNLDAQVFFIDKPFGTLEWLIFLVSVCSI